MTQTARPTARYGPAAWRGIALRASPLILIAGIALARTSPSVPLAFEPRKGPPDTLRASRLTLPNTPNLLETRYLERTVARRSPDEAFIAEISDRYNITEQLARTITEIARAEGIDPELGFRLVRVESVFDAKAFNPAGGMGLTQLMPGTARDIDPSVRTTAQIMDPRTNLRLGFRNLRNMLDLFKGDVRLAVIAYNRGEVAVQRAVRRGRDPENGYGKRVLGAAAHGGKPYSGPGLIPRRSAPDSLAAGARSGAPATAP